MSYIGKEYICNRDKFLEIKKLQKETAQSRKDINQQIKSYYKNRRDFYHNSRGVNVPNWSSIFVKTGEEDIVQTMGFGIFKREIHSKRDTGKWMDIYEQDGFTEKLPKKTDAEEARHLNVIYGIIKGKEYKQIEQKVREGNELNWSSIRHSCLSLGFSEKESDAIIARMGI